MNNIYIAHIESHDSRYTGQLRKHLSNYLRCGLADKYNIIDVDGEEVNAETTPGAFLNFVSTNVYKSTQCITIFDYIAKKEVKDGDIIFFTDAWNPTIIQLRYTLDLMNIKAKIAGYWHAGSYDRWDFLGRLIKNKEWSYTFEKSLYYAIDYNFFATNFHIDMFCEVLNIDDYNHKITRAGLPLDFMQDELSPYSNLEKENIILFPHRIAPEKQIDIFKDLEKELPEYKFVVAQEQKLTKHEYHTLLGKSKMIFSANLQETLGISPYEGALCGAIPFLPDRLSYREMYSGYWLYSSEWTEDIHSYEKHKELIKNAITYRMDNYSVIKNNLPECINHLSRRFFNSSIIIETFRKIGKKEWEITN